MNGHLLAILMFTIRGLDISGPIPMCLFAFFRIRMP
jgi:hypothetical protein